jgi:hypothetical protein
MKDYRRYFERLCRECGTAFGDNLLLYVCDYYVPRKTINYGIKAADALYHCRNLMRMRIPYKAFLGALAEHKIPLFEIGDDIYMGISDKSLLMQLWYGKRINENSAQAYDILDGYGTRGLDPDMFSTATMRESWKDLSKW